VIGLLQCSFGWIQVGLKPETGLILMARGTLNALGILFQLGLVHNVFSPFKSVVAVAALNLGINVLHVRKRHRRPTSRCEYRLIIQDYIFWLGAQVDNPKETYNTQDRHPDQKISPSHACSPRFGLPHWLYGMCDM
jgi:hypothetical protein